MKKYKLLLCCLLICCSGLLATDALASQMSYKILDSYNSGQHEFAMVKVDSLKDKHDFNVLAQQLADDYKGKGYKRIMVWVVDHYTSSGMKGLYGIVRIAYTKDQKEKFMFDDLSKDYQITYVGLSGQ